MRLYTSSAQKYLHCLLVFYLFYILSTCVPVPPSHCPNSTCFHSLSAFISFSGVWILFMVHMLHSLFTFSCFLLSFSFSPYVGRMNSLAQLNIDYSVLNLKHRSFLLPVFYRFLFMHWTILVVYPFFSICWNTFQKAFSCHITYDLLQILQQSIQIP